jgi:3-hydroxy-9,10-secoandrosta-1,3,5(10)-triene-9,17-dione monooxygenase
MIANMCAVHASSWSLQAQEEVWSAHPEGLVCGVVVPTGRCAPVPGGFEIQGRWPYASNCDNSDWIFVAARLPEMGGKPPDTGLFLLPISEYGIDHDSWRVAGMQGTGSKTLVIETPVFVPEHRCVRFGNMVAGTTPGRSVPGNFLTNFPFATFSAVVLVAPMLGMAQGSLDSFTCTMREKVLRAIGPGPTKIASHTQPAQVAAGAASAAIDSGMGFLLRYLLAAERKIFAGETLTIAERIDIRRATGFAARQASTAVNTLFEAAGSSAAALSNPIQRHWRDVNVAARHVSLDVEGIYALVGQERFGMDPAGAY